LFGSDIDGIVDSGCGSAFMSTSAGLGVVDPDGNPGRESDNGEVGGMMLVR
jgi:hypothetical protein